MQIGTMSRKAKGRVVAPPQLDGPAQSVSAELAACPDVIAQAHWEIGSQTEVNGADFYLGEKELGHIHLDGEAHIPLGRRLVDALVRAQLARRLRWSREFAVLDTEDAAHAIWAFGLRRAQIDGVGHAELCERVVRRATEAARPAGRRIRSPRARRRSGK